MTKILFRRLLIAIPLLLAVSAFVFALINLGPGDPAHLVAGQDATPEQVEATRERLGLNDSMVTQYIRWVGHAARGDLGTSLVNGDEVSAMLSRTIPVTISLAIVSLIIAVLIGVPLGIAAALRPGSWLDRLLTTIAALVMAMPPFVVGLALVIVFAIDRAWLPATGYVPIAEGGFFGWLKHLILPGFCIALTGAAELARQTRGALMDSLGEDYTRTARSKGLPSRTVVGKHAMKNAAIPIVTVFGLQIGRVISGLVTVEFVFGIPGLGTVAYQAVTDHDIPVIQGVVLISTIAVLLSNLVVDLSYGVLNPRLRREAA